MPACPSVLPRSHELPCLNACQSAHRQELMCCMQRPTHSCVLPCLHVCRTAQHAHACRRAHGCSYALPYLHVCRAAQNTRACCRAHGCSYTLPCLHMCRAGQHESPVLPTRALRAHQDGRSCQGNTAAHRNPANNRMATARRTVGGLLGACWVGMLCGAHCRAESTPLHSFRSSPRSGCERYEGLRATRPMGVGLCLCSCLCRP